MYEENYIRENLVEEKSEEEKNQELLINVIKAKRDLENANNNFQYAEDELIDYYTYQIKALQSKIDYLLKKAKNSGLALEITDKINLRSDKIV